MKIYKYHFYNGFYRVEEVEVDERAIKFIKFNELVGQSKSDIKMIERNDKMAIDIFEKKHKDKVIRLQKQLEDAKRQLEIIKNIKNGVE